MHSIVFFNNKGGVGKTTLLCNVAGYLALKLNKKVLVVDADPQCNATQNLFPDAKIDQLYKKGAFTIESVVKPLSLGKGYSEEITPIFSEAFGVDVIPGDPKLALTEDLLATDWGQAVAGNVRGLRTTLLFRHLLSFCTHYDYVIFDVGPSLGAINRSVLLANDFFVTPMSTDIFSLKALDNISLSLAKWRKQFESAVDNSEELEEVGLEELDWKLTFLGYVTQQYTAKKDANGQPRAVNAFDKIIKKVPATVKRELIEKLQPEKPYADYALGSIPTLHSLIPLSQTSRRPIFALRAADGVVGAHFTKVSEFDATIKGIVQHLLTNIETLK